MALSVAHLIYGLDLGGLEQLVVQLADRSRGRGIETSIVALGHDGPVRELARRSRAPQRWRPSASFLPASAARGTSPSRGCSAAASAPPLR